MLKKEHEMLASVSCNVWPLDIDECDTDPTPCGIGHCWNNVGSYVCICPKGYYWKRHDDKCVGK